MTELAYRLDQARKRGLNDSDLSLWFGRSRQSIRLWRIEGKLPREPLVLTEVARRLDLLEASRFFPMPYEITQRRRKSYVLKALRDAESGGANHVSSGNPAGNGAEVCDHDRTEEGEKSLL
jgi:hypothetical protein